MAIKTVLSRREADPEIVIQGILHSLEHAFCPRWFSGRDSNLMNGTQEVSEGFTQVATCNSDFVHGLSVAELTACAEFFGCVGLV